ncbi:2370_t:CDS:2 [Cetraspora pellucida]|uniref:2370_t:CDS:1 n=1 Tax=Cetraspora pellucida TaxID=1433469 RepID=A0A9N8W7M4_9GLOM|nr:2370_t:CDS:2 [Cetraspora pellucida]
MKAIVINKFLKTVDELEVDLNAPEPELKKNQVLVEVKASALNYFDILQAESYDVKNQKTMVSKPLKIKMIQGRYQVKPPFPFILGAEFAGVVIAVHPTVNNKFKPGDKVFGYGQGSLAERVATDIDNVHLIPDGMSFEEASGLFITCPTSYTALVIRANLQKDEWCLVHAAAGGVGIAAVQIAKALGAKVIATSGSENKLAIAKNYGADFGVNYNDKDWQKQVLKITGGHGVDVVYDPVGLVQASLKFIAWSGRILVIGFAGENLEKVPTNLVLLKNVSIIGVFYGTYKTRDPERVVEVWNGLFKLFAEKKLKSVVYKNVYHGLHNVKYGLKAIANRETYGKVVVTANGGKESKI